MSPESFKLEQLKIELGLIVSMMDKAGEEIYLLSKKSAMEIEENFHDAVTNRLKGLCAMAENIESQVRLSMSFARKAS